MEALSRKNRKKLSWAFETEKKNRELTRADESASRNEAAERTAKKPQKQKRWKGMRKLGGKLAKLFVCGLDAQKHVVVPLGAGEDGGAGASGEDDARETRMEMVVDPSALISAGADHGDERGATPASAAGSESDTNAGACAAEGPQVHGAAGAPARAGGAPGGGARGLLAPGDLRPEQREGAGAGGEGERGDRPVAAPRHTAAAGASAGPARPCPPPSSV